MTPISHKLTSAQPVAFPDKLQTLLSKLTQRPTQRIHIQTNPDKSITITITKSEGSTIHKGTLKPPVNFNQILQKILELFLQILNDNKEFKYIQARDYSEEPSSTKNNPYIGLYYDETSQKMYLDIPKSQAYTKGDKSPHAPIEIDDLQEFEALFLLFLPPKYIAVENILPKGITVVKSEEVSFPQYQIRHQEGGSATIVGRGYNVLDVLLKLLQFDQLTYQDKQAILQHLKLDQLLSHYIQKQIQAALQALQYLAQQHPALQRDAEVQKASQKLEAFTRDHSKLNSIFQITEELQKLDLPHCSRIGALQVGLPQKAHIPAVPRNLIDSTPNLYVIDQLLEIGTVLNKQKG